MTPAQLGALKADILADPVLAGQPNNPSDATGAQFIADAYNAASAPQFFVWRSLMSTQEVFDQVVWANLTPNDPVPATASATAPLTLTEGLLLWKGRSLACQGKQFNLQTMLTGRDSINPAKANIRAGLQDALTQVPSGASGALRAAGWAALQTAMSRVATRVEKLFATGTGTQASPATMGFEGAITYLDVFAARNS